jgi:hypothetical protein
MTQDQRVLHTVLATCLIEIPEATGDKIGVLKARIAYLENRLEEIGKIVEAQVEYNARMNAKGD